MQNRPQRWFQGWFFLVLTFLESGCQQTLRIGLGVEEIEPQALFERLSAPIRPLVIDVRESEKFELSHIPGAVSLNNTELSGYLAHQGPPQGRPVVTTCNSGFMSLTAAALVSAYGYREVYSLRGGMNQWIAQRLPLETGARQPMDAALLAPPLLPISLGAQIAEAISGIGIKSLYMLLAALLIVWLWRKQAAELRMIRNALIWFLAGESFCAVNYLFFGSTRDSLELMHGVGMIGMNVLLPMALYRLFDKRVLRLTDPEMPCSAMRFCIHCWKKEPVACGLQRLFMFLAPMLSLVALMPLFRPIQPVYLQISILGSSLCYQTSALLQLFEFRLYPLLAAMLMWVTFGLLLRGKVGLRQAQWPFFIGFGLMGFSLLRFFLMQGFRHVPIWADVWEELTELFSIVGVGVFLIIFKHSLEWLPSPQATDID